MLFALRRGGWGSNFQKKALRVTLEWPVVSSVVYLCSVCNLDNCHICLRIHLCNSESVIKFNNNIDEPERTPI